MQPASANWFSPATGGDRGDEVGGLAGEALAHRRAVRHAGEEDALRIDRGPRRDVGEQCTDVADVVDAGGARGAADADVAVAPAAGVPGANAVRIDERAADRIGAVRKDDRHPGCVGDAVQAFGAREVAIEARELAHALLVAAAAMQRDDHRDRLAADVRRRQHEVVARSGQPATANVASAAPLASAPVGTSAARADRYRRRRTLSLPARPRTRARRGSVWSWPAPGRRDEDKVRTACEAAPWREVKIRVGRQPRVGTLCTERP